MKVVENLTYKTAECGLIIYTADYCQNLSLTSRITCLFVYDYSLVLTDKSSGEDIRADCKDFNVQFILYHSTDRKT